MEGLLGNAPLLEAAPGEYIFREGEPADFVCLIREGKVKLSSINAQGKEDIVLFLGKNEYIWEDRFLTRGRFSCSAVAMSKTSLYRIERSPFLKALRDGEASLQIVSMLSGKLRAANERNQLMAVSDPLCRVAGFLLCHLEEENGSGANTGEGKAAEEKPEGKSKGKNKAIGKEIRTPMIYFHLEEIASFVNLRMETVSRKLKELSSRRLIQREGKGKIRILDPEGLRRVYQGEEAPAGEP